MVEKVQNIEKNGYNPETIKQNVTFNSFVWKVFRLSWYLNLEKIIFCTNMAAKQIKMAKKIKKSSGNCEYSRVLETDSNVQ